MNNFPGPRILMPAPAYVETLEKKIAAARNLADSLFHVLSRDSSLLENERKRHDLVEALFDWMTLDLRSDLDAIKNVPPPSPIDQMNALQEQLDRSIQKKEQIEPVFIRLRAAGHVEIADVLEMTFMQPLDDEIAYCQRTLSEIQAAAEKAATR